MYLGKLVETAASDEPSAHPLHPHTPVLLSNAHPVHPSLFHLCTETSLWTSLPISADRLSILTANQTSV